MPAVPGTVVPLGSLITPAGDQGPPGMPGSAGPTAVSTMAGNRARLGPDSLIYVPPDPFADNTQGGLLRQLSGNTTDFVDGTNTCQPVGNQVRPVIWYARQRSFNALGNPNFEVDQRNAGNATDAMTGNAYIQDRWQWGQTGSVTGRCNAGQQFVSPGPGIAVPGTNFLITSAVFAVTMTVGQATLGTNDAVFIYQQVEGSRFREMATGDGHSFSLLVNCSSALTFSVFIRDASNAHSLVIPCTIPANVWTVVSLPNLAAWPSNGVFYNYPGIFAYTLGICLAAGSGFVETINEPIWQNGNFLANPNQDNFLDLAENTTFQIAFMQHEPGQYCSYFQDLDFEKNLDGCMRYFQKSYPYAVQPGASNTPAGAFLQQMFAGVDPQMPIAFNKVMATTPSVYGFSPATGAVGYVRDTAHNTDRQITGPSNVGDKGFSGFTLRTDPGSQWTAEAHWIADTGF